MKYSQITDELKRTYWERNRLLCALTHSMEAYLARHEESDTSWDNDWRNIVVVISNQGEQMSWHIHDSELPLFSHLEYNSNYAWDGHSTDEKYDRLARSSSSK